MSLIHEALEKANRKANPETIEKETVVIDSDMQAQETAAAVEAGPKESSGPNKALISYIILAVVGSFFLFLLFQASTGNSRRAEIPPAAVIPKPAVHQAAPVPKNPAKFRLSGISTSASGRVAIINDQVVAVGDPILDATVKNIDERSVVLESRNREIKLSL